MKGYVMDVKNNSARKNKDGHSFQFKRKLRVMLVVILSTVLLIGSGALALVLRNLNSSEGRSQQGVVHFVKPVGHIK